jgi:LAO/AO transport system kinase
VSSLRIMAMHDPSLSARDAHAGIHADRHADVHANRQADTHADVMQRVLLLSALQGQGVAAFWEAALQWRNKRQAHGLWQARRSQQAVQWMWEQIHSGLRHGFESHPQVKQALQKLQADVLQGQVPPSVAARQLLQVAST